MRILLTSILCKSGLATHVWDLATQLTMKGIQVTIGLKINHLININKWNAWLVRLQDIPAYYYTNNQELSPLVKNIKPHIIHAHSTASFPSSLYVANLYSKH